MASQISPVNPFLATGNVYSPVVTPGQAAGRAIAAGESRAVKTKTEFMAIYYKELLKQVFKAPDLKIGDDEDNQNSAFTAFNSDVMVEQLAQHLAERSAAAPAWTGPRSAGE